MLDPRYLSEMPEEILKLFTQVEAEILADMAKRIAKYDYWISSVEYQSQKLRETGVLQTDILKALSALTRRSESELRKLMQEAESLSLQTDAAVYEAAGMTVPSVKDSEVLRSILNAGYKTTAQTMQNICRTTARTAVQQFEHALDGAWLKVHSGAFSAETAIESAVKELSEKGLQAIRYPSGRTDSLEVAVRRAVVTGVNQTSAQLQEELADELECDLVEVSAHSGARPEHAVWQGRIFSRSGTHPKYPDFRSSTGYGQVDGLCEVNCRHTFGPFIEGGVPVWSEEKLKELDEPKYEYGGKQLTEYEASQVQRYNERQIRRWQREYAAMEAAGLDTSEAAAKLKHWQGVQADFVNKTGLVRQYEREQIKVKPLEKSKKAVIIRTVKFDDKQFGKKVGKHAQDFGLTAKTPEDRARMKAIIVDIAENADEKVVGEWRGQSGEVIFYIKGDDVVVVKGENDFVTVLKGGINNERVKKARKPKI